MFPDGVIQPSDQVTFLKRLLPSSLTKAKAPSIATLVQQDMQQVLERSRQEIEILHNARSSSPILKRSTSFIGVLTNATDSNVMSEKAQNLRLLSLFQQDLISGIQGQVLENSQKSEDECTLAPRSASLKLLVYLTLLIVNLSMLFYVFLFAIQQPAQKQRAWARSFGMWLIMEIFLISTFMTLLMNIVIPSMIRKEIMTMKQKIVQTIIHFNQQLSSGNALTGPEETDAQVSIRQGDAFNAAQFFFVSYQVAQQFRDLKVAKMILSYHTVWPRQSFKFTKDVTTQYSSKFAAIKRAITMVLTSLLTMPLNLQDLAMKMTTTIVFGYSVLVHLQLYQIYPVLVIVPLLLIGTIAHFVYQAWKSQEQVELQQLLQPKGMENKVVDSTGTAVVPVNAESKVGSSDEEGSDRLESVMELIGAVPAGSNRKNVHINRRQSMQVAQHFLTQTERCYTEHDMISEGYSHSLSSSSVCDEGQISLSESSMEEAYNSSLASQPPLVSMRRDAIQMDSPYYPQEEFEDYEQHEENEVDGDYDDFSDDLMMSEDDLDSR